MWVWVRMWIVVVWLRRHSPTTLHKKKDCKAGSSRVRLVCAALVTNIFLTNARQGVNMCCAYVKHVLRLCQTCAALTSNMCCANNKQRNMNQILLVFGANRKEVWGAICTGLNDIYVPHDMHDASLLCAIDSLSFIQRKFKKI